MLVKKNYTLSIILLIFCFCFSQTNIKKDTRSGNASDTLLTKTKTDTLSSDSLILKKDTLLNDSLLTENDALLKKGKKTMEDSISFVKKHSIGGSFRFMIPAVNKFVSLRSSSENSNMTNLTRDAENKFSDNDITWPIGICWKYAFNDLLETHSDVSFFWINNSCSWTPKQNDTVYTKDTYTNMYDVKAFHFNFGLRTNISPDFIEVNKYNKFFAAGGFSLFPLILFSTERTEMNKKINSKGFGYGGYVSLGLEKYVNKKTTFTGRINYNISLWHNFIQNKKKIKNSDIFINGNKKDFYIMFKSLNFSFYICRWF